MRVPEQDAVDLIRERIIRSLLSDSPSPGLQQWLAPMLPDGSWADIAYDDPAMGSWAPMAHLQRLREAAVAYRQEGHALSQRAEILAVITCGLRYWFARNPVSRNWWFNFNLWIEHGVPGVAASYQYVVRPGVDFPSFEAYAAALPIRVLSNTPGLQAVAQIETGVTGAVVMAPAASGIKPLVA